MKRAAKITEGDSNVTILHPPPFPYATNQNACLSVAVFLSGWLGKAMKGWKDQESRKAQRLGKARKD